MKKQMGEFEERPKVKEAVPIPLRRRRPTGWITATIVFALISASLASFIVIDKVLVPNNIVSVKKNEPVKQVEKQKEPGELREEIDSLMVDLQMKIGDFVERKGEVKRGNNDVIIKIGDNLVTTLSTSESVEIADVNTLNADIFRDLKIKRIEFEKTVFDILENYGLKENDSLIMPSYMYTKSFKNKDGVICQYGNGDVTGKIFVNCGHESWISDEKAALMKELLAAYQAKENTTPVMISADEEDIQGSSITGYERLRASVGRATALYYRKAEGKWQYLYTTNNNLVCERFTGDAAKAYAGETCISGTDGKSSTILK